MSGPLGLTTATPTPDAFSEGSGEVGSNYPMPVIISSSQSSVTSDALGLTSLVPSAGTIAGTIEIEIMATADTNAEQQFEVELSERKTTCPKIYRCARDRVARSVTAAGFRCWPKPDNMPHSRNRKAEARRMDVDIRIHQEGAEGTRVGAEQCLEIGLDMAVPKVTKRGDVAAGLRPAWTGQRPVSTQTVPWLRSGRQHWFLVLLKMLSRREVGPGQQQQARQEGPEHHGHR